MRIKLLLMLLTLIGASSAFADETNLLAGWDGGGYGQNMDKTPADTGWTCSADVKWNAVATGYTEDACYRDFATDWKKSADYNTRWFTHGGTKGVFAFPVALEANTTYKFSGEAANMNHDVTTVFGFNSQTDAQGKMVASKQFTAPTWSKGPTTVEFEFTCDSAGTYYFVWYTPSPNDRNQIANLSLQKEEVTYPRNVESIYFQNPDFENGIGGWTSTTGAQNNATATNRAAADAGVNASGAFSGKFYENWNASAFTGKMYQTATVPNGVYKVDLAAFVNTWYEENATDVEQYVFANHVKMPLTSNLNENHSTYVYVADGTLTVGVEQDTKLANWMGLDNLKVVQYDPQAVEAYNAYATSMEALLATEQYSKDYSNFNMNLKTIADDAVAALKTVTDAETAKEKATELETLLGQIETSKAAYANLYAAIAKYAASGYANSDPLKTELETAQALYDGCKADDQAVEAETSALETAYSKTKLNAQTYAPGDDVTSKISNPKFNNADETSMTTDGWTVTSDGAVFGASQNKKLLEAWHADYSVRQKLTGLKDGVYALTIQGFQRPGDGAAALYKGSYLTGNSATSAYVFAGDRQVAVANIFDVLASDNTQNGGWSDLGNGYYAPNDMNSAYTLMSADDNNYKNVVLCKVTDNQMTIGFKSTDNKTSGWSIFHDFTMTYLGEEPTLVSKYLDNLVSEAKDLSSLYPSMYGKTALTTAIANTEEAAAGTDVDDMLTSYYDLVSAMEAIRATSTVADSASFTGTLREGKDIYGNTVGLATFSSPRYAVSFAEGADATTKAFVATAVEDGKIICDRVYSAPANTGLLIMGDKDGQFEMNGVDSVDTLTKTNLFLPAQNAFGKLQEVSTESNYSLLDSGTFAPLTTSGKMGPNEAYLHADGVVADQLTLVLEDPTSGVKTVRTVTLNGGKYYNLNGMEMAKPTQRGVYIQNGKKYVVR